MSKYQNNEDRAERRVERDLKERIRELETALEKYADKTNWEEPTGHGWGADQFTECDEWGGEIASAALAREGTTT